VSELLNFDVQEFLGDLSESVEIELVKGVEELKKELKKTALQKNMKAVTDERLEEACQALLATMRKHFSRNTGKFELYARRNIFCMPEIGKSSGAGGSGATEQADVEALKAKYSELQDDCSRLAEETNNLDSLLKEMRSALYNVRVAAQSLESKDQSNLAETVASLNNQKTALSALTRKAKGTVRANPGSFQSCLLLFLFIPALPPSANRTDRRDRWSPKGCCGRRGRRVCGGRESQGGWRCGCCCCHGKCARR